MKTLLYRSVALLSILAPSLANAASGANWTGVDNDKLRNGDVGFETIPTIIMSLTNFILGLSGTISMVMIIYGAVQMSFGSYSSGEKGKKIISGGIIGFVISVSGWFIIRLVIDNL